jgi:hypothetical protein|nr:MAG TPA: hypothetical protein [Caudoviricetes sp.]
MYTFLIGDDNTLTASVTERIMERSKMVDNMHFLADQIYKDVNMSDFTVMLEYVLPISKKYKTEFLKKSENLYKNKLEYLLPFDTNLTSEAGDIEIQLTFTKVEMNSEGKTTQYVRKVGPGIVHIIPISKWSDIIPDEALSTLDQRIIALEALNKAMTDRFNINLDNKADNLMYDDEHRIQLTSNGKPIGNAIKITTESVEVEDGSLRVVQF